MENYELETVFDILDNVGFFDMKHTKVLITTRLKVALYLLPKTITKILNHSSPAIEIIEISYEEISDIDLEGQGIEKIIIPSKNNDISTRREILRGLKKSGHFDTLTEATNLSEKVFKRGEIRNEQQYRKTSDKFLTH